MKDILTEGYIGISYRPDHRFNQHKSKANSPNSKSFINRDFKKELMKDSVEMVILVKSTREYCNELEYSLRPSRYIGWNVAQGGENTLKNSTTKHALSRSNIGHLYYYLKRKSKKVYKEWEDDVNGLPNFQEWLRENYPSVLEGHKNGSNWLWLVGDYFHPEHLIYCTMSEYWKTFQKTYFSKKLKRSAAISQWSEEFDVTPNTISSRMYRGWSLDEALGVTKRDSFKNSREEALADPIRGLFVYYLENTLMTPNRIAKELGIANVNSRLEEYFRYHKLPKWIFSKADCLLDYDTAALRIKRNRFITDFQTVSDFYYRWEEGASNNQLSKEFSMGKDVVKTLIQDIENAEYHL